MMAALFSKAHLEEKSSTKVWRAGCFIPKSPIWWLLLRFAISCWWFVCFSTNCNTLERFCGGFATLWRTRGALGLRLDFQVSGPGARSQSLIAGATGTDGQGSRQTGRETSTEILLFLNIGAIITYWFFLTGAFFARLVYKNQGKHHNGESLS